RLLQEADGPNVFASLPNTATKIVVVLFGRALSPTVPTVTVAPGATLVGYTRWPFNTIQLFFNLQEILAGLVSALVHTLTDFSVKLLFIYFAEYR
ncbi:MAG: hypothetical protein IIW92_07790, partial [Lachnospiraceae bacterium]|nr:hypothetical protein [Lachnospiraceae bacterium]